MRALLAGALLVGGLLACAFGVLVVVRIPRSDTATWSLVGFALTFALPGLVAIGVAARMLRRG